MRDWGEALLDERRLRSEGVFQPTMVRNVWDQHVNGGMEHTFLLWSMLMFQAWHDYWSRPAATEEDAIATVATAAGYP